jgi:hypothetical protein
MIKQKEHGKKHSWTTLRYYPNVCFEGLGGKVQKELRQDSHLEAET